MDTAINKLIRIIATNDPSSNSEIKVDLNFLREIQEHINGQDNYIKDLTNQYEELKDYNRLLRVENNNLKGR